MQFEFADAEVAHCHWEDGQLQLRFSAVRLWEEGIPKADPSWGPLLLLAEGVEPWESLSQTPYVGRLRDGCVLYASQRLGRLSVPDTLQGVITMALEFAQGGELHVRCTGLHVQSIEGRLVGAYQC